MNIQSIHICKYVRINCINIIYNAYIGCSEYLQSLCSINDLASIPQHSHILVQIHRMWHSIFHVPIYKLISFIGLVVGKLYRTPWILFHQIQGVSLNFFHQHLDLDSFNLDQSSELPSIWALKQCFKLPGYTPGIFQICRQLLDDLAHLGWKMTQQLSYKR